MYLLQVTIRQNVEQQQQSPAPQEILENGLSPLDGILPKDPSFGKVEHNLADLLEKKESINGILPAIKEKTNHVDYTKMNGDSGKRGADGNLDSIVPAKKPALEAVVTNGFSNGQVNGGANLKAVLPGGQVVQMVSSSGQVASSGGQMVQMVSSGGQMVQLVSSGGQMTQSGGQMMMTNSGQAVILNTQASGGQEPQQLIQTSSGQLYLKTSNGGGIVMAAGNQQPAGVLVQQSQPQAVVLQPQQQSAVIVQQQQQQQQPAVIVQPQQQQAVLVQTAGQQGKMVLIQQEKQQQPQQQYVQQVIQTSNGQQVVRQVLLPSSSQNHASPTQNQQLPVTKIVHGGGDPPVIQLDGETSAPPTVIQRANTPQLPLTNGQSTPPPAAASPTPPQPCPSPPPVKIDPGRPFLCEWGGCMRPFKTPKEVNNFCIYISP